ncbi:MAG: 30S ribosomal protein S12 methylthiotransferase RimO [Lachnospiraceae bacterium]|nr:30S ribosomal protein S12 methylthiotransferase RimO [Lachnospiraceae bacterium]
MKIHLISLGCDKNLVDAEVMSGLLVKAGHQMTDDDRQADVIIVNTCCFIGDAKEESIGAILEAAKRKEDAKARALIVTGCLAERYRADIEAELPEVDAIVGTTAYPRIAEVIEAAAAKHEGPVVRQESIDAPIEELKERIVSTPGHYAYLKIAEGCGKHCTYCIIPKVRGNYRSRRMEELTAEAGKLAEGGVKELILVAQETTLYGVDLYGKKMLPELLRRLSSIEGLVWIRILYCYPEEITEELIAEIRDNDKVCKYLDIPIQHAADGVLKRMGRRTTHDELVRTVKKLREEIQGITLRTTLISGFPGETEEDHRLLCDFIKEMRFDRLGVFEYSKEEGTPAAKMKGQIKKAVKKARRNELMEIQQRISAQRMEALVGQELPVMIEGRLPEENILVGRTEMDAPDVDGLIFLESGADLLSGTMVTAVVTAAAEYDLYGRICDESAE